jgi:hypothetical protein
MATTLFNFFFSPGKRRAIPDVFFFSPSALSFASQVAPALRLG